MADENPSRDKSVTQPLSIHGRLERDLLGEALNLVNEKYKDGCDTKKEAAEELRDRLPPVESFENESSGSDEGPKFFQETDQSFEQVTESSFLGIRQSNDIRVRRVFRTDLDTGKTTVEVSYLFGDHVASSTERELGRAFNIMKYTSDPLSQAKLNGEPLEDYLRSIHMGSLKKDDKKVSDLFKENPNLKPHIWRNYSVGGGDQSE